ncbi:hypothetical protein [Salinicola salarius]|uniref:hypothetical protein n=1 Tax=Salinicola salarius TaxID=430457 RepID=UPI000B3FD699|nr:hypothetical protein [Salinicola salarius]
MRTLHLSPPAALVAQVAEQAARPQPEGVAPLVARVQERFGQATCAVLFYGSCLRSHDPGDGVVDLYALVDRYAAVYDRRLLRLVNAWLPPNVFYLEAQDAQGRRLRAKCAVITLDDFAQGATRWFESYLWGRFAQPCRLAYCRDEVTRMRVNDALAGAVLALWRAALPCLPDTFEAAEGWQQALALSYGVELRPEGASRPASLLAGQEAEYRRRLAAATEALPGLSATGDEHCRDERYRNAQDAAQRRRGRRAWRWRRRQGHVLHIARLMKAVLTFENGVDYVVWKLERHSGRRIPVSDRLRRHPLLFGWPLLWRLLRERVLR